MALDGITIASIVKELKDRCIGARVQKIAQPLPHELILTLKGMNDTIKVYLSADATLPCVCITSKTKPAPLTAPNFCMLLRKYIQNGRIVNIEQPGLERCVHFLIERYDEMGDNRTLRLIIEIMGKHSNIIFVDESGRILDSIKHVNALMSSVREVLPGKQYVPAPDQSKRDLLCETADQVDDLLASSNLRVFEFVYQSYTGISPFLAKYLCGSIQIPEKTPCYELSPQQSIALREALMDLARNIREEDFWPTILLQDTPVEYLVTPLPTWRSDEFILQHFASASEMLETYYAKRRLEQQRLQQSYDLRQIVSAALEKRLKKRMLYEKNLEDTKDRETYRIYGELLHTYGYMCEERAMQVTVPNYYTDQPLTIPLDPTCGASTNAKLYFDKYNKMKRAQEALTQLIAENETEITYLESILSALEIATSKEDLEPIRQEIAGSGYQKKKNNNANSRNTKGAKPKNIKQSPLHYRSSDGYDLYVGKNNYQNEELTFTLANGNDWWFHAKGIAGSHVILKTKTQDTIPDRAFEEAAKLAAYYSRARGQAKAQIDYTQKKHVKKPNGAKPGFVIYHTNYSLIADTDISDLVCIQEC
ncbi:MAG: NFACT family protein [Clostridium sp.]|nr:NFACT family protein [Clostridium sp.]